MNSKKFQTGTKTEVTAKTALFLGIISAACVATSFLAMAISFGQKLILMLK
jgi:hypothetical protein